MRAHDPAAAQGARRPREIALAKSEPGEDAFRFRLDLPVVLIFQCLVRLAAGELEDRFFAGGRGLLREVAERDTFLERDFARVGRCFIENEREERRFAGAVRADKADAIAAVHLERDILEEDAPGERFADLRNGEHGTVEDEGALDLVHKQRRCRRRGSNPHTLASTWILSPARLPVPPRRLFERVRSYGDRRGLASRAADRGLRAG